MAAGPPAQRLLAGTSGRAAVEINRSARERAQAVHAGVLARRLHLRALARARERLPIVAVQPLHRQPSARSADLVEGASPEPPRDPDDPFAGKALNILVMGTDYRDAENAAIAENP